MAAHEIDLTEIGPIVLFHRKKSGLSRIQLATLAGVGKTAIYDLEHGKPTLQLETVYRILRALNIRIELWSPLMDLYDEEEGHEAS